MENVSSDGGKNSSETEEAVKFKPMMKGLMNHDDAHKTRKRFEAKR